VTKPHPNAAAIAAEIFSFLGKHGPSFDDAARREALTTYVTLVDTWNRKQNLTGAHTIEELVEILVGDAVHLAEALVDGGIRSFVDVGAGAGAPAIPLLALLPETRGVLVEPARKRVTFMRLAIGTLGLGPRARVLEQSVDQADPSVEGAPFDVALSRATFSPEEWLPVGLALGHTVAVLSTGAPRHTPPNTELVHSTHYTLRSAAQPRWLGLYRSAH
jgi:16S rRNA G527 N7-methylase RsmG